MREVDDIQFQVRQEGSITAFAVLMLVAIFVLMGLVVDGGMALSAHQAASDEAEQAAHAGAGELSLNALRSGVVQLDQQEAVNAAEKFTIVAGHPGTATASATTVTVVIQYRIRTEILGIVGLDSLPVSASASALDVHGVTVGS